MQSTKQCRVGRLPQGRAAQVGYCQGMAFVTGIVLMYLPEEPAFQARAPVEQAPSALGLHYGAAPIPYPMQLRSPIRKAPGSVLPHRPRPWSNLASCGARALLHPSAPCCKAPHGSTAGRAGSDTPRRWSPVRGRKPWQQGVACDGAPTVTAPHGRQPAGRPQVLVRLLGPGGPDLRAFYLPGLEGLKAQLRMLEWLMERAMRPLKEHLEARACSG